MKELDDITGAVVDASVKIHMDLWPGLLESVLARALQRRGLSVERQKAIRSEYEGMVFEEGLHRIVNHLPPQHLRVNQPRNTLTQ
jgi:hypothetical protein